MIRFVNCIEGCWNEFNMLRQGGLEIYLIFSYIFSVIVVLINYCSVEVLRFFKIRILVEDIVLCLMFDVVKCFISQMYFFKDLFTGNFYRNN